MKPSQILGSWRVREGALELSLPTTITGLVWTGLWWTFSTPQTGSTLTSLEIYAFLGTGAAFIGWMAGRHTFMASKKSPWRIVITAEIYLAILLAMMPGLMLSSFTNTCTESLKGQVISAHPLVGFDPFDLLAVGPTLCQVGGIPENPYLPGVLYRLAWDGTLTLPLLAFLFSVCALSALGTRERRARRTVMGGKLVESLQFAIAAGSKSALGKAKVKEARVEACANSTLWGELCAQTYSADAPPKPGTWCPRCKQAYTPCRRTISLKVVTLFHDDIELLNGIERVDTVSWERGEPMPPDARLSGVERWVTLGHLVVPEVLSMAQVLALTHEMLPVWKSAGNKRVETAVSIAMRRASKISAWLWFGPLSTRLTYARPSDNALLAGGPNRIRDMIADAGDEVWLQLDIGLLPLELRTGFMKKPEDRDLVVENSKTDLWIPVAPPGIPSTGAGAWVPRIEGAAIRSWLSLDRLRGEQPDVLAQPVPYQRYEKGREVTLPERLPQFGSLDYLRQPLNEQGSEPLSESLPGGTISDWDWFDPALIQLLRQQALVLVERQ